MGRNRSSVALSGQLYTYPTFYLVVVVQRLLCVCVEGRVALSNTEPMQRSAYTNGRSNTRSLTTTRVKNMRVWLGEGGRGCRKRAGGVINVVNLTFTKPFNFGSHIVRCADLFIDRQFETVVCCYCHRRDTSA